MCVLGMCFNLHALIFLACRIYFLLVFFSIAQQIDRAGAHRNLPPVLALACTRPSRILAELCVTGRVKLL